MNAMTDSILKSLVCGAAALLITMVVSLSSTPLPQLRSFPDGNRMPCLVSRSRLFW